MGHETSTLLHDFCGVQEYFLHQKWNLDSGKHLLVFFSVWLHCMMFFFCRFWCTEVPSPPSPPPPEEKNGPSPNT